MKAFLCTVLLVVGLASVSLAQQQVMQIRITATGATTEMFVITPTVGERIELPFYSARNTIEIEKAIMSKLQEYLNKGWKVLSHSSSEITSNDTESEVYILVKDE